MARLLPKRIRKLDITFGGSGKTEQYVRMRLNGPASIEEVAADLSLYLGERVPPTTLRYWLCDIWGETDAPGGTGKREEVMAR